MKSIAALFLFIGLAKQCSKVDTYAMLDKNTHPDIVHKMELILANDLNSDDSATADWAKTFMEGFETEFKNYQPDRKTLDKLKKHTEGLEIKVIGGNWCSDTRREVPRLCKVLYFIGVPAESYSYFRVDKLKKPVENDFAATRTIGSVPDIVVFKNGVEVGRIIETPRESLEKDLLALVD